eukprot:TRINITY_DN4517_c0_g1_i1.p1 TRINITY_DN4517_c0_g1~~TRINITY_DN4517_c0_g1_i1.p1  ORF type:complete len:309 (-),score=34.13 TRINITY_DN4517_c0_g1_i1:64-951(-)
MLTLVNVSGHGRFIEPPSRASMWRHGFKNPRDYNDNEGFCGGLAKMIQLGGCGICGDAIDIDQPRPHETGGRYGNGIIVRAYNAGSIIDVTAQITANHRGYFTFRICPSNNKQVDPDQDCFDNNVLKVYPEMTDTYVLPDRETRDYNIKLQLPSGMTCSHCIIQWSYTAGNNWGVCEDGTQGLGCGTQEMFRACSDVSIQAGGGVVVPPTTSRPNPSPTTNAASPTPRPTSTSTKGQSTNGPKRTSPTTSSPSGGGARKCTAVGIWAKINGMTAWCAMVCNAPVPYCPSSHCACN